MARQGQVWGLGVVTVLLSSAMPLATADVIEYSSRVDAQVTPQNGTFLYEFTVVNTTPNGEIGGDFVIVNWELPIFAAADIIDGSVQSPDGWQFEIIDPNATTAVYNNQSGPYGEYRWDYQAATDPALDIDPDLYGPNPEVFDDPPLIVHWYTTPVEDEITFPENPIFAGNSLSGFQFESDFGPLNGPYQSSWFFIPPVTGDPPLPGQGLATPNSPARQAAQGVQPIPEPASVAIWLAMITGAVCLYSRRRAGRSRRVA